MSDLIERQAAIDATWKDPSYTDPLNVLTEVRDRIKALPSVQPYADEQIQRMQNMEQAQLDKAFELGREDAKPIVKPERKKGKWILADAYAGKRYRCSECLAFALKTDDGQENLSDYCPVCGARMGEGGQK